MKTFSFRSLFVAGIVCSAGLIFSLGAQESRFYVKADLGGNITTDARLKDFFGVESPGSKVKFDPGVRLGISGGYHVTDWLGAEVETGIMANSIKSITDADRVDAVFSNVPFLANLRLQC